MWISVWVTGKIVSLPRAVETSTENIFYSGVSGLRNTVTVCLSAPYKVFLSTNYNKQAVSKQYVNTLPAQNNQYT